MFRAIGILIVFYLPVSVLADDAPFWLSSDKERGLIPQHTADRFLPAESHVPEPEFSRYDNRPPPSVPPREDQLIFYPCSQCHEFWETNPERRELAPVHNVGLQHGQGRLWCLVCHDPEDSNKLQSLRSGKVDFNESWRICGQCHSARQKDWYFGAHGKRVYDWQGEPERYNCTHCHNPHRPPFIQRKPQPKPPVRAGLQPMQARVSIRPINIWGKKVGLSAENTANE